MKSFRALIGYMRPYWRPALLAPLLMALEVAMDLAQPRLLQDIIDLGLAQHDLLLVEHIGMLMIGAALIGSVGGIGCTIYATIAALGFGADIRGYLFRKVQSFSFRDLDRLETGRLVTRLTNDVDQVQDAAAMFLRILVRAPLLVVGSLIMCVVTAPRLALLLVPLAPLLVIAFLLIMRNAQALFTIVQDRLDRVNMVMQENLAGVRVIKAFVRWRHEAQRFGVANDGLMTRTINAQSLIAAMRPIMMLLISFGVVGVIWLGGWLMHSGDVHIGQILAFINYLTQVLFSMVMVAMLLMRVARAEASAARIKQVLDAEPTVQDTPEAVPVADYRGRVQFDEVEFSYDGPESQPVLRGVSFTAEPGETIAVLGATGSGKSTLINLIGRFYDVQGGGVLVDGHDARTLRQDDLRAGLAVVPQETVLFSGTIRDNIRFGRPKATEGEVEAAARRAQAHDFIMALPEGYDTVLGQRGVNLSGGQKQRLTIARALVAEPAILIMDDCTSAVDGATEAGILEALDSWDHSCTRFIVAQRIASVLAADKILILEDGRIVAAGTHAELLKSSPVYQDIVKSQFSGVEVPDAR